MNLEQDKSAQKFFQNRERCFNFLESIENDLNFLERVITGNQTWVFEYDLRTKCQSKELHTLTSTRSKKNKNEQVEDQMYDDLLYR